MSHKFHNWCLNATPVAAAMYRYYKFQCGYCSATWCSAMRCHMCKDQKADGVVIQMNYSYLPMLEVRQVISE